MSTFRRREQDAPGGATRGEAGAVGPDSLLRTDLVQRVVRTLESKVGALREASDPWEVQRRIVEVEHVILSDLLTDHEECSVVRSTAATGVLAACQDAFCRFETTLEKSVAQHVMASGRRFIEDPDDVTVNYLQRYRTLATRELLLANIGPSDKVLFIGSGPLPITAIEFVRQVGCTVECVDHLAQAIEISSRVVSELRMEDRLRPVHAKGQEVEVGGHDVILVAVLAEPKRQILSHIDGEADVNARILCRTTVGIRQLIYARTEPFELARFHSAGFSQAVGEQVLSTQLLKRQRL